MEPSELVFLYYCAKLIASHLKQTAHPYGRSNRSNMKSSKSLATDGLSRKPNREAVFSAVSGNFMWPNTGTISSSKL